MEMGWRVDERRPERLRWWDGEGWGHDTVHRQALHLRLQRVRFWGAAAAGSLVLAVVALLVAVWVDVRNIGLVDTLPSLAADPVAQQELLARVATSARTSTSWTWLPLLAAAVSWSAWHHHLAHLLPSALTRRTPDAQALLWWVPGANLVLAPLLLVGVRRGLRGGASRGPGVALAAWWLAWVALAPWVLVVLARWLTIDGTAAYRAHFVATVWLQGGLVVAALLAGWVVLGVTRDAAAYVARVDDVQV